MPHQSTHTSTATISHAPGAPSQPSPYSSPISSRAPRPPSMMSLRHTGRSRSDQTNGPASSSACRPMTSLWPTYVTISALLWLVECMACWWTLVQTSFKVEGWARWQSGWTITFSSGFYEHIYPATTCDAQNGAVRFKRVGGTDRKAADYGMVATAFPVVWQRSSMRTAAPASVISCTPPLDPQLTVTSPMWMHTSTSCHHCSVSSGRAQRQSPLEKRSHIWASAGTYTHRWYTYQTGKK